MRERKRILQLDSSTTINSAMARRRTLAFARHLHHHNQLERVGRHVEPTALVMASLLHVSNFAAYEGIGSIDSIRMTRPSSTRDFEATSFAISRFTSVSRTIVL